ncbi:MAG: hypothetical protein OMM_13694 [Candidatus Magnetoglobus multicellularis str. Araruama]|uniref:Outer membrane efflux protein n=1 Tax=Candidatus Magnetoglobus multicellularis str. Araruama TaxID=890399 RepID=A0A1V1NTB0_9BACT|nr:MAG: hypothetical protein OMM_13694 [Candidatus Magnetoglobus multicellularis str. Araruama]
MNFGAKAEQAKLKEAQYNLAHTKQENVLQKKSLYLSLINLKNQFDYLKTQINKYETMYHLYESIVKTEENDYHIGKEQLEQLVRAINKKNQYKQKINTLLVQKQKVYLEWLRLTDSLVK